MKLKLISLWGMGLSALVMQGCGNGETGHLTKVHLQLLPQNALHLSFSTPEEMAPSPSTRFASPGTEDPEDGDFTHWKALWR